MNIIYNSNTAVMILVLMLSSCSRPQEKTAVTNPGITEIRPDLFSGTNAYKEVSDFLVLSPRVSGSPGCAEATEYISHRLKDFGIEPLTYEFQEVTLKGNITFRNVLAVIEGSSSKSIIITSHYDTKSGISDTFTGANDSGSSTGLLLEMARVLSNSKSLPATIILAFLDGEECAIKYANNDGLYGSRHFANSLAETKCTTNVLAVIVADMIGDKDLTITIPKNGTPDLISKVFNSAREENARLKFSLKNSYIIDDHVPFMEKDIPAVDLIDFQYGSKPTLNDYWHTKNDTIDKLSPKSLEITGRVIIRTVNKIAADQS